MPDNGPSDNRRFDGGDESRVQALMAENQRLTEHLRQEDLMRSGAERELVRLRKQNDSLAGRLQRTEALLIRYVSGKVTRA